MKNLIFIDDQRTYTLQEFSHVIKRVLTALGEAYPDRDDIDDETIYPGREVFFTIKDLFGFINDRVNGEFTLIQGEGETHRHYEVIYLEQKQMTKRARKHSLVGLAKTAVYLEKQTGKLPAYAQKGEVAEIVQKIKTGNWDDKPENEPENEPENDDDNYDSVDEWIGESN